MEYFAWFERTDLSIWVREEWWVFPLILSIHAIGMGLAAGSNFAIALRMLGVAKRVPLSMMARFVPLAWIGFIANVFSGLFLLAGYPAKALTNPIFYCKLVLLAVGMWLTDVLSLQVLRPKVFDTGTLPTKFKGYAIVSLLIWIGVITTGRFLAYTNRILLASWFV